MKTFNHVKLSELDFELESETTEAGRTYKTPGGKSYPSITTVLSNYNKKGPEGPFHNLLQRFKIPLKSLLH